MRFLAGVGSWKAFVDFGRIRPWVVWWFPVGGGLFGKMGSE
jgi:hypothetical protein